MQENKTNVSLMTITELKAIGFDLKNKIEIAQYNLKLITDELIKREKVEIKEDKKE